MEYDKAVDKIESLKKEAFEVTKDLKQSVDQYTDTKLKLTQAENQLEQLNKTNQEMLKQKEILETDFAKLQNEVQQKVKSCRFLEWKLKAAALKR